MIITKNQKAAFVKSATSRFEENVLKHAQKFFPKQIATLGKDKSLKIIGEGVIRAAQYGLHDQRNVCFFIDLIFGFGIDYDTRLQWANAILTSETLGSEHRGT